jgi:threonine/homoserine/homoserine lactone efflux protein
MIGALVAFALAAGLLTITPGLDTAIVLRASAIGPRAGAAAALGVCAGLFVWGAAAALGLGALLAASPVAYTALKGAGAAYLVFIGARLILQPRASFEPEAKPGESRGALRRGFLTNVLNPKVGVFYATFLPQFVPADAPVAAFCLALAGVHAALAAVWFAALIALTLPLGRALRRPEIVRAMDRVTGGVFVAFGAKLALTRA